ncbi:MAG TPA: DUF485 domain-containing protein [Solirubrobacteraceae bacterium]|nr:DUF485 domain-containing protein [Solirubrobacteraceae bacterium]
MSGSGRFERAGQRAGAKAPDWLAIERSSEFKELVETRRRIITPLTVIWLVVSIGYLILAAFVPGVMGWQVVDGLPFAWLAAITQVILTWAITWSYLRKADRVIEPLEERAAAVAERKVEGSPA